MALIIVKAQKIATSFKPSTIFMSREEFNKLVKFLEESEKPFIVFKLSKNLYYLHFFKSYVIVGDMFEQGDKRKS